MIGFIIIIVLQLVVIGVQSLNANALEDRVESLEKEATRKIRGLIDANTKLAIQNSSESVKDIYYRLINAGATQEEIDTYIYLTCKYCKD